MQRNFEPMRMQVEAWQRFELTDVTAKVVIYEAFVEGKLEAPSSVPTFMVRLISRKARTLKTRLQRHRVRHSIRRLFRKQDSSSISSLRRDNSKSIFALGG